MTGRDTQEKLQKKIIFPHDTKANFESTDRHKFPLAPASIFNANKRFESENLEDSYVDTPCEPVANKQSSKKLSWAKLGLGITGVTLLGQFVHYIYVSWTDNPISAIGWTLALCCFFALRRRTCSFRNTV